MTKASRGRSLTLLSGALFVAHFYGFWILASTFAAGLVWWMNLLIALGPVAAVTAFVVTLRQRAQPLLASVNGIFIVVYGIFWAWLILDLR
ncbi:hypothetical protein EDS67_13480 [candidate division KSB1 bacterium]|nr:MAG: hypothetical protein EDS67_13480 [candidate division KSB1 bacterium]MBC6951997.1 hypothetical protein [candidate division KSB1 bacterium]MCE7942843.1 hypothetical protein [Chlorobi bacterium CHB1]MDL1875986.1 hypothetical protein [Cytophagia bacterium CHB2]